MCFRRMLFESMIESLAMDQSGETTKETLMQLNSLILPNKLRGSDYLFSLEDKFMAEMKKLAPVCRFLMLEEMVHSLIHPLTPLFN